MMSKLSDSQFTYHSCGLTNQGCVRDHNEDAFLDAADKGFWVVADGAGGHESGDVASNLIVSQLADMKRTRFFGNVLQKVTSILENVNHELIEKSGGEKTRVLIASTVSVLIAQRSRVVCLWSGDSRIYRLRQNKLVQLTRDHNRVDEFIAAGFTPEAAEKYPMAQHLTAAVGVSAPLYTETQTHEVEENDVFLLCSDGLFKELSDEDIQEIMRQDSIKDTASELMDHALAHGAIDNVTVLVVKAIKTI